MSIIQKFTAPDFKTRLFGKLKPFFDKNREKILLTLGVVIVALVGFFLGRYSIKTHSNDLNNLKGSVNVPIKEEIQKQKDKINETIDTSTEDIDKKGTDAVSDDAIDQIGEE